MDLDQFKYSWKKNKERIEGNVHLNKEKMEALLKKQTDKTTYGLSRIFIMGIVVQSLTIVIQLINAVLYAHVKELLVAIAVTIGLIVLALFYTVGRYSTLKSEVFNVLSLSESLRRKIEFFKFSYNKWLVSFAASFVVFLWSINMVVGDYTSLHDLNFRVFSVYSACFLLIYFSNRYAAKKYLREFETSLNDLGGNQLTDLKEENRKYIMFKIILGTVLFLTLIAGIFFILINQ